MTFLSWSYLSDVKSDFDCVESIVGYYSNDTIPSMNTYFNVIYTVFQLHVKHIYIVSVDPSFDLLKS